MWYQEKCFLICFTSHVHLLQWNFVLRHSGALSWVSIPCGSLSESTNADIFLSLPNTKIILKRCLPAVKFITQSQTSPWDAALGLSACLELPFGHLCDVSNTTRAKSHSDLSPRSLRTSVPQSCAWFLHSGNCLCSQLFLITFSDTPNPNWQTQRKYHFFYKNTFVIDFSRVLLICDLAPSSDHGHDH